MTSESDETRREAMNKPSLVILATLLAVAVGAFPATIAAHGDEPENVAHVIATALKDPVVLKGSTRLTIVHIQKGCHIWTTASGTRTAGVKVVLRRGERVTVLNQDLDAHRLVRMAGPKVGLGKPLAMNDRVTLTFTTPGTFKLRTKKVEMPGMLDVETTGADHILALLVVVR